MNCKRNVSLSNLQLLETQRGSAVVPSAEVQGTRSSWDPPPRPGSWGRIWCGTGHHSQLWDSTVWIHRAQLWWINSEDNPPSGEGRSPVSQTPDFPVVSKRKLCAFHPGHQDVSQKNAILRIFISPFPLQPCKRREAERKTEGTFWF